MYRPKKKPGRLVVVGDTGDTGDTVKRVHETWFIDCDCLLSLTIEFSLVSNRRHYPQPPPGAGQYDNIAHKHN